MEGSGGNLSDEFAVVVVEVEVPPSVALRPVNNFLLVVNQAYTIKIYIGVEPLLDYNIYLAGFGVNEANVNAL